MNEYLKSVGGRVLTLSCAIALMGGGLAALVDYHTMGLAIIAGTFPLAMAVGVFGACLSSDENTTGKAAWAILGAPVALFCYAVSMFVIIDKQWTMAGFAVLASGLLLLSRALFVKPEVAQQKAHKAIEVHAH